MVQHVNVKKEICANLFSLTRPCRLRATQKCAAGQIWPAGLRTAALRAGSRTENTSFMTAGQLTVESACVTVSQ